MGEKNPVNFASVYLRNWTLAGHKLTSVKFTDKYCVHIVFFLIMFNRKFGYTGMLSDFNTSILVLAVRLIITLGQETQAACYRHYIFPHSHTFGVDYV